MNHLRNCSIFSLLLLSLVACARSVSSAPATPPSTPAVAESTFQPIASLSPRSGTITAPGETITLSYTLKAGETVDSVVLSIEGERMGVVPTSGYTWSVPTESELGRSSYTWIAYHNSEQVRRSSEVTIVAQNPPQFIDYQLIKSYPHDTHAYTQGLLFHDGSLYESTGIEGQSTLREVELETGRVLRARSLPSHYFGEGLELVGDTLYQLTWQNGRALLYGVEDFKPIREFTYGGEGWGLASDDTLLYMSNGTERIQVLDPKTFTTLRTIEVYSNEGSVPYINEMEWIDGAIWANVYTTNQLIRIDPATGAVTGVVDLSKLLPLLEWTPQQDVLNGIAYNPENEHLYVTGKNWNLLFEIKLTPSHE